MKTILFILFVFVQTPNYAQMKTNQDAQVKEKIQKLIEKQVKRNPDIQNAVIMVHSNSKNIHWNMNFSKNGTGNSPDQPYHIASIGKTFTAIVIAMLEEKGKLSYSDPIHLYLDKEIVNGLHIYKGVDYSNDITIHHLLTQTSGLADYFMDKNREGISGMDLMLREPEHFWTPLQTIEWTKNHLNAHFPPGKKFHYSDTNYQLLGLIIEKLSGKPLHEAYADFIFIPANMKNSYLHLYSQPDNIPQKNMAPVYYKGVDISGYKSISMSWASGGIVSTNEDMLNFFKAFNTYKFVSEITHKKMHQWVKANPGMNYGYGLMHFRFLRMPENYNISGHSGSIGSVMYYNKEADTYIIGTFNKLTYTWQPVMLIIRMLRKIQRL